MKKEHDKSCPCDQFADSVPTRDVSSLSLPFQSSPVYSLRYLCTTPSHSVRSVIQMEYILIIFHPSNKYVWLASVHTQMPWEKAGMQKYLSLGCAAQWGWVPAPQTCLEQVLCWRERECADTHKASTKDKRRSSQPHWVTKYSGINNRGNWPMERNLVHIS